MSFARPRRLSRAGERSLSLSDALESSTLVFTVRGPIARADLAGLCERVCGLLQGSDAALVICDVGELVQPDAVTVDAVARLQLAATRQGRRVRLRHASVELQELLVFMGLGDVVPAEFGLRLEARREPEEREHGLRVEEERELDDPAVLDL